MIETRLNKANLTSVHLRGGVAEGTGVRGAVDLFSPGEQTEPGLIKPDFGLIKPSRAPLPTWPIPAANAQGDYQVRTYCDKWQVTDPTGLNVRMPAGFPEHPDSLMEDWPVLPDMSQEASKLGSFPPGTNLTPVMGSRGIQYLYDVNRSPWMMVEGRGADGNTLSGFVRSNAKHIRPRQD